MTFYGLKPNILVNHLGVEMWYVPPGSTQPRLSLRMHTTLRLTICRESGLKTLIWKLRMDSYGSSSEGLIDLNTQFNINTSNKERQVPQLVHVINVHLLHSSGFQLQLLFKLKTFWIRLLHILHLKIPHFSRLIANCFTTLDYRLEIQLILSVVLSLSHRQTICSAVVNFQNFPPNNIMIFFSFFSQSFKRAGHFQNIFHIFPYRHVLGTNEHAY